MGSRLYLDWAVNKTEAITTQMEMSLHNLYVTLLSEGGLILVVLMGLILYQIWKRLVSDTSINREYYFRL